MLISKYIRATNPTLCRERNHYHPRILWEMITRSSCTKTSGKKISIIYRRKPLTLSESLPKFSWTKQMMLMYVIEVWYGSTYYHWPRKIIDYLILEKHWPFQNQINTNLVNNWPFQNHILNIKSNLENHLAFQNQISL